MERNYEEIYHTQPEQVKLLPERVWMDVLLKDEISKLVSVCNKPKTMDQIFKDVRKQYRMKKSDSTLYRFFKTLIKEQVILEVGNRVFSDKRVGKRLFVKAGDILAFTSAKDSFLKGERGYIIAEGLGYLINHNFSYRKPNSAALNEFLQNIEASIDETRLQLQKKVVDNAKRDEDKDIKVLQYKRLYKRIKSLQILEYYTFYSFLGIIHNLLNLKMAVFVQKLEKCFFDTREIITEERSETSPLDIIKWSPELIKIVDTKIFKLLFNKKQASMIIMRLMRTGPKTIQDIYEMQNSDHEQLSDLDRTGYKKKEKNTIYKNIQELIKHGFIVEAGKRVIPYQSTSQMLYGRSAELYVIRDTRIELLQSKSGQAKNILELIGEIVKLEKGTKNFDKAQFTAEIQRFVGNLYESIEKTMKKNKNPKIREILFEYKTINEGRTFAFMTGLTAWILDNNLGEFQDQIEKCFV